MSYNMNFKGLTKLWISLIIIFFWAIVILILSYTDKQVEYPLGRAGMYYLFTMITAIPIALFALIGQQVVGFRVRENFFYNLIGLLNLSCGLVGTLLFCINRNIAIEAIIAFCVSLVLGIIFMMLILKTPNDAPVTKNQEKVKS